MYEQISLTTSLFRLKSCLLALNSKPSSRRHGTRTILTACSNHSEQLWIWNLDEEERLFYDTHEMVRLQVIDEEWHDQTPIGPTQAEDSPIKTPYRIKGSMAKEGLGVCLWWDGA